MDEGKIRKILEDHFNIAHCEVRDHSAEHYGHREASAAGGSHFALLIVSLDFNGKRQIERHRMVYNALKSLLGSSIHALALKVYTPGEFSQLSS